MLKSLIIVRPLAARLLLADNAPDRIDSYVEVQIGYAVRQTAVAFNRGSEPAWTNQELTFKDVESNQTLQVRVRDSHCVPDAVIGSCEVSLEQVRQ